LHVLPLACRLSSSAGTAVTADPSMVIGQ